MNISELSVRRPIFMSCVLAAILVLGIFSLKSLPLELFPDVAFPVVTVQTIYPGAGPTEIETLVSKPIEEELGGIAGVKNIRSINRESMSFVVAEFNLEVDVKYAEQQVRDKISGVKGKLPDEIEEPVIRKIDPADQPIMVVSVNSPLKGGELYDLANDTLRPQFEQVNQVGRVEIYGGRKREIQVQLDRKKLKSREMSASQVVASLKSAGQNIPAGKIDQNKKEIVFRTLGEFNTLDQIQNSIVTFFGNDVTTTVNDIGKVVDTLEDEKIKAYLNGETTALLFIYKQSRANTVKVANDIKKKVEQLNGTLKNTRGEGYSMSVVRDMSRFVMNNIMDVLESIAFGICLTIFVVFLFLGSLRSTLITGLAIPVSLIGGMTLIYMSGLTINIMTMLAFSLAVGLLIDDAIVVRENIFRHLEMGKGPIRAALEGTREVSLAVIAVTLAILAVFGPIAFLQGVVGQFFKSFGLGVCFVMMVSLFDALSNAPMLSAYLGGTGHGVRTKGYSWTSPVRSLLNAFDALQTHLENTYAKILQRVLRFPGTTLMIAVLIVIGLFYSVKFIPKTFLPPQDSGEFGVALEMQSGTTLEEMNRVALEVDKIIASHTSVVNRILNVGNTNGQSYKADFYVTLVPFEKRTLTTTQVKAEVRELLKPYLKIAAPKVKDIDFVGAGQRPFVINVSGQDLEQVRKVAGELFARLEKNKDLLEPEITDKPGLPEYQVKVDLSKAQSYGVSTAVIGGELRAQVEGIVPAKFREKGLEYDIRVRVQDDQRDLEKYYSDITVPNLNGRQVSLSQFSKPVKETGFATINRENRGRYVSIEADLMPGGKGMGGVIDEVNTIFNTKQIELPPGVRYRFVGQAENFQELMVNMLVAGGMGILFIYLVLASLYESLVTPITIMLVIPFAVTGGFLALLIMGASLDLFSMIGCIMLMGLATKNSIIMVDYVNQKIQEGHSIHEAIMIAGRTRLRPILMTSFALIAGMMPVAIGLNEASSQRTSLGISVVGGVIISTFLTLFVIPAVFNFMERGRQWMIRHVGSRIVTHDPEGDAVLAEKANKQNAAASATGVIPSSH